MSNCIIYNYYNMHLRTIITPNLILWNDYLTRLCILCVGYWMLQNADTTHHLWYTNILEYITVCIYKIYLSNSLDFILEVSRITNHSLGLGSLHQTYYITQVHYSMPVTSPPDLTPTTAPFSYTISSTGLSNIYVPP